MEKQRDFLRKNFTSGNIAHAFLFSGEVTQLRSFAKELTQIINCSNTKKPCRACHYCVMIEKESFPDLSIVTSAKSKSSKENERDMMEISIEQVREVQNFLGYMAYYGNYKTVIIENAERMNVEAQSCFLKTLEEPKGKTVIFLLTQTPEFMMPTIASRCQHIKFFGGQQSEFLSHEQKLFAELKSVLSADLAEKFNYVKSLNLEEGNFTDILHVLEKHFRQLLLSKIGVLKLERNSYTISQLKSILQGIEQLRYQAQTAQINKKLALELLFLKV